MSSLQIMLEKACSDSKIRINGLLFQNYAHVFSTLLCLEIHSISLYRLPVTRFRALSADVHCTLTPGCRMKAYKLPYLNYRRGDFPCTGDVQLTSRSEGGCTYLVSSLQIRAATFTHVNSTVSCFCNKHLKN